MISKMHSRKAHCRTALALVLAFVAVEAAIPSLSLAGAAVRRTTKARKTTTSAPRRLTTTTLKEPPIPGVDHSLFPPLGLVNAKPYSGFRIQERRFVPFDRATPPVCGVATGEIKAGERLEINGSSNERITILDYRAETDALAQMAKLESGLQAGCPTQEGLASTERIEFEFEPALGHRVLVILRVDAPQSVAIPGQTRTAVVQCGPRLVWVSEHTFVGEIYFDELTVAAVARACPPPNG